MKAPSIRKLTPTMKTTLEMKTNLKTKFLNLNEKKNKTIIAMGSKNQINLVPFVQ